MPDELKNPIFLLGNVRSGTTLVQDLFALHPEVAAWFEPRTVWMYADPGRDHDRFDASDARPRVKRYIRKRFLKHQREHGGKTVMEKTPSNLMRLPHMHAIFPESKYVYVVRHPFAYLSSAEFRWRQAVHLRRIIERFLEAPKTQLHHYVGRLFWDHFRKKVLKKKHVSVWGVRYPGVMDDLGSMTTEEVIAKQWAKCCEQVEQDIEQVGRDRVHCIRYEDLVADPVPVFRGVLNHFGLDLTPEIEQSLSEQIDPTRGDKWHRLDPSVVERCLPLMAEQMQRYGYETDPGSYEQRTEEDVFEQSAEAKGSIGSGGGISPLG
jgi:hypothetical protein